jgi:phospholipase C
MSWTGQSWGPQQPRFVADLTGNGAPDIVGFGLDGVWTSLNNGDGTFQPPYVGLFGFSFHTGWMVERHLRFVVDITGDGCADLVGFGEDGVWVAVGNGDGTFQDMKFVVSDMGYNQGFWDPIHQPRYVADITGNGKADLVGFGHEGVWVALGNGDGTFQGPELALPNVLGTDEAGWLVAPRLVSDVTGEGRADLVGFGSDGVWVVRSNKEGSPSLFQPPEPVFPDFNQAHGWQPSKHLRIMGDLDGAFGADIIGFGNAGIYTALSNGNGTFAPGPFIAGMGYDDGWRIEDHPRLAADVTGDGKADLVGFGYDGVWFAAAEDTSAQLVLDGFSYYQGWRVASHPRYVADLDGDGKADIIGFGDAGVWVALSNKNWSPGAKRFEDANLVLPDFGYHAGPVVQSITVDFHTQNEDLAGNSLLHVFVKNRSNDSSDSAGPSTYVANLQDYQDHDADWFSKNPYLGFAINASQGQTWDDNSTHRVNVQLRSRPIPIEELLLPAVNIHILARDADTWKFDYTLTITLDDGTVLPPFNSNINGLTGIVLDADDRDYYGICSEVQPIALRTKPVTDSILTGATIEFHTHEHKKKADTTLDIHISNRWSATGSQDIVVATDVAKNQTFWDYNCIDLPLASNAIYLRDMVLPVVFINIAANEDPWNFDYRVTFFFGQDQPYSWTVSGVVLDDTHHKHMGVYDGRPFSALFRPYPPLNSQPFPRNKTISLAYVGQKLDELFNRRQVAGSPDPVIRLKLDSATGFGGDLPPIPPSFVDVQFIKNDPPPLDDPVRPMVTAYSHSISDLGQFIYWFGLGVQLNDVRSQSLTLRVNSDDSETPLTLDLQFETGGPIEITGNISAPIDVTNFEVRILLTLRYHQPTNAVDLFGWIDDINALTDDDDQDDLKKKVIHVSFAGSNPTWLADVPGEIQKKIRDGIFNSLSQADPITKVTPRDSLNATASSWLMGSVIASGNPELLPYLNPCTLVGADVNNDVLSLEYISPEKTFTFEIPPDWPSSLETGNLANIDHIVVLTQENRSFDHMLGYLSLPFEKGGMNRTDVDGLKGGEFNVLDGRRIDSFRFATGDTIFSPGPLNDPESVAVQINDGAMDGFAQAQADGYGPTTAHRVMGYHAADNVPTFDSLARDFAVGHRWFAPHPGSTLPNRFYQLTGRPNIDPWGAWEYSNSSPIRPVFTDTIFDHLSEREVSWTYFEHFFCSLRYFERHTFDWENVVSYEDPERGFAALAKSGNLPSVSFIDPHFVDYPPDSFCDEPPSDIRNSQPFIRALVETLVASPIWEKTLLIIIYDEHGGFYDHVPPVPAVKVSREMLPTTGLRVPCFVISPWVKGGTVFGSDTVHFDHTSILKTIARRFMSDNPPYMGARYAAAHDLSEVLNDEIRPEQFRPFIPYNLECAASKKYLEAPYDGTTLIGPHLWQTSVTPWGEFKPEFQFEDAGGGFVFIRTKVGLYVTADAPLGIPTDPGATLDIKQDLKYAPGSLGSQDPNLQRWRFASSTVTVEHPTDYTISCAAVPGKVLQPFGGSTASGIAVVLADPAPHGSTTIPNPWIVTSPLLPSTGGYPEV